jgi:transposase InsO family protein
MLGGIGTASVQSNMDETLAWLLWCNQTRMHSTLNYLSPAQFEDDWNRAMTENAA